MSTPRHSSLGLDALGGGLSVAALLVLAARWLPLDFTYHPNVLGIVSLTTEARYPTQQETILYLAFGAAGVLGVWALAGWLGTRRFSPAGCLGFEAVAFAALASSLLLPRGAATAGVAMAAAGLVALARRSEPIPPPVPGEDEPAVPGDDEPAAATGGGSSLALALGVLALSILRVPRFLQASDALASDAGDLALARNDWVFLSEDGQHLAWADSLLQGGLHGRDFYCLYGPLYDWSVVWIWKLFGRSVAGWHFHVGVTEVLAWVAFLSLAALLLRRRWLLLPLAVLTPHLMLRLGLAFASLVFLFRHGRDGRPGDALGAGLLAGVALLYSQEFGLAAVICAAVMLGLTPTARGISLYAVGVALVVTPLLGYYAAEGALGPMLADLAGYPALLVAGFGNLPFPSLRASLPWPPWPGGFAEVAVFYAVPAVLVVALGTHLPRRAAHPRSPLLWFRQLVETWRADAGAREVALLALFGLVAFRSALGRSDTLHLYAVAAPATLILVIGCDRLLPHLRRRTAAFQLGLGALLVGLSGMASGLGGAGLFHLHNTVRTLQVLASEPAAPSRGGAIGRAVRWLEANSNADDRFYFLPNEAALYYLTGRPAPTRFVVGHQMVTDAHRAEALRDLQAAPPRYVVWNDASLELDGFPDSVWLGPELWDWLHAAYEPRTRQGGMRIWEWKGPAYAAGASEASEAGASGPERERQATPSEPASESSESASPAPSPGVR